MGWAFGCIGTLLGTYIRPVTEFSSFCCRGSRCPDSLLWGWALCGCRWDIWEACGAAGLWGETRPKICHDVPARLPTLFDSLGTTNHTTQKISFSALRVLDILYLHVAWLNVGGAWVWLGRLYKPIVVEADQVLDGLSMDMPSRYCHYVAWIRRGVGVAFCQWRNN